MNSWRRPGGCMMDKVKTWVNGLSMDYSTKARCTDPVRQGLNPANIYDNFIMSI